MSFMSGSSSGSADASQGLGALGSGFQAAGDIFGGIASEKAYGYQAQIANINAALMKRQAENTLREGNYAESASRMRTTSAVHGEEAIQAASGADTSGGSAAKVRSSTQVMGNLDALTIRYNAAQKAYGEGNEAASYHYQAEADKAAGSNALIGGFLQGAGDLIGGSSSMMDKAFQFMQAGAG